MLLHAHSDAEVGRIGSSLDITWDGRWSDFGLAAETSDVLGTALGFLSWGKRRTRGSMGERGKRGQSLTEVTEPENDVRSTAILLLRIRNSE